MAYQTDVEPSASVSASIPSTHWEEVHEEGDFRASVHQGGGIARPIVRLDASLRGSVHEGQILRDVIDRLLGGVAGYVEYTASPDGSVAR